MKNSKNIPISPKLRKMWRHLVDTSGVTAEKDTNLLIFNV